MSTGQNGSSRSGTRTRDDSAQHAAFVHSLLVRRCELLHSPGRSPGVDSPGMSAGVLPHLLARQPAVQPEHFVLDEPECTLGRGPMCEVVVPNGWATATESWNLSARARSAPCIAPWTWSETRR